MQIQFKNYQKLKTGFSRMNQIGLKLKEKLHWKSIAEEEESSYPVIYVT
jgi:hypothetical protein